MKSPADLRSTCRRIFDQEPHQVRHMLLTFKTRSVAAEFLISPSYVRNIAMALGVPGMPLDMRRRGGINGHGGNISAWRTPDLPRMAA